MKHIAVVEDEALMREELADMLRRAGYAVTEVTDFADVTGQILALAPDLVLLDLNLPEVSGFQICRDLKQRSALPVLVLTSRDQLRDEVHALELGADEYLTKPFRMGELRLLIDTIIENRRLSTQDFVQRPGENGALRHHDHRPVAVRLAHGETREKAAPVNRITQC